MWEISRAFLFYNVYLCIKQFCTMRKLENTIKRIYLTLLCIFMCGLLGTANAGTRNVVRVSPADLQGDGQSVYQRLREIHASALAKGSDTRVVYPKGVSVRVVIPSDATPIPLTSYTDFGGCRFVVENTSVDRLFLFSMDSRSDLQDIETVDFELLARASRQVQVSGKVIDGGDFSSVPALAHGHKLLYVYDRKEWSKRDGRLSIYRRDIIHIIDGKAQNHPIYPYSGADSLMCLYDEVKVKEPSFKNLRFTRSEVSTKRTFLLKASGQMGLKVRNLSIETPKEDQMRPLRPVYEDDQCLYIRNSVGTLLENVSISGSYSATKRHGYGLRLINLYDTSLRNVQADAPWGITCGFFLNWVTLDDCVVNRFDCHCYCSDFTYRRCTFQTDTSQYSSRNCMCQIACAFGYMRFLQCRFVKARPLIIEHSYTGAFTGFELSYRDCIFDVHPTYYCLVEGLTFSEKESSRCLPNLHMRNCTIRMPEERTPDAFFLYHFNSQGDDNLYRDMVHYQSLVSLERVRVVSEGKQVPVRMCNKKLMYNPRLIRRVRNCSFDSI